MAEGKGGERGKGGSVIGFLRALGGVALVFSTVGLGARGVVNGLRCEDKKAFLALGDPEWSMHSRFSQLRRVVILRPVDTV